jgi:hypothetical protein
MNCSVTLTADEFKTLHNALWSLQYGNGDVTEQVEIIRGALSGAYDQEREDSDRRYDHYSQVRKELGLDAVWSMYEVDNLSERHPFEGVKKVIYSAFGSGDHEVAINGSTWAALYVAGNALIRDSGDQHHIYIEGFKRSSINPEILFMSTGS